MANILEAEDDVITIGKLRRPGRPAASITYDPLYGIRVEDEQIPPEPVAAAFWIHKSGGWVRFRRAALDGHPVAQAFVKAWRQRNKK